MKKGDTPSEHFVGAILRAYDKASGENGPVTCSKLWDQIVMQCLHTPGGFVAMFAWDTSKSRSVNRIGTIAECIRRGHVPGLALETDERGREVVVRG